MPSKSCLNKHYGACSFKKACGVNNCSRLHNPLLHYDDNRDITAFNTDNSKQTLLKMISVKIRNGNKEKSIVALLDEGATLSLIDLSLVNELNLQGVPQMICSDGINNTTHYENK